MHVPPTTFSSRPGKGLAWVGVLLILLAAGLIRGRMLDIPLERDEGEYAYMGQLLLQGIPPYQMHGTQKFPGVYYACAAAMAVFGETARGVHLGLLVVNAATTVCVFLLGRRVLGAAGGVASAGAFALLSMSPTVLGFAAHMTHFVMLPVVAGLVFLWRGLDSGRIPALVAAGVCLGVSIVMRQTSLVFVAFGGLFWLAASHRKFARRTLAGRGALFGLGVAVPLLVLFAHLALSGVVSRFWESTVAYALAYGSEISLADGVQSFFRNSASVIGPNLPLWIGAAAGLILALRERSLPTLFLAGFLLAGLAAICPGLHFRRHYFVQVLPAVALLFGLAMAALWDRMRTVESRVMISILLVPIMAYPLIAHSAIFFVQEPNDAVRSIYGLNPFPEAVEIARHIREHSAPNEAVAILGSEPEIFFYAQRHSATRSIFTYPLLEGHRFARPMQEEMAREIETTAPAFIVFVNVSTSWLVRPTSEMFIFRWAEKFLSRNYEVEGVADMSPEKTDYVWGREAAHYRPRSPSFVALYRRKSAHFVPPEVVK